MTVSFQKLLPDAILPCYAHPGDAGMDLYAAESAQILPGEYRQIRTGLAMALPPGTEAQIRPRSGLAARNGIGLVNSPGTIDEGYRGEIKVLLINQGKEPFLVQPGKRIAQMVIAPVLRVDIAEASVLSETERGQGGFGSTGE